MGAAHSADGGDGDPPAQRRRHVRRRRHSVDSVASYSSQNHVDRIRTQNFSAASCSDDAEFGSIKSNNFRRSTSNLEFACRRPESVTSNASSTRSRLRELVERKSQEDHKPPTDAVGDIQYFDNPTETLEFDTQQNGTEKKSINERPKKRKLSRAKDKEQNDNKPKKQEKYQSKLAEYYKLPNRLPQDDFYQHLTKSKAAEDLLQRGFANSDTEFSGNYGRLCKHKESDGTNLRRSRSLAVIREETFTDLQIQNHSKTKRSQLIPRARLFDKPCFKDRLPSRAKYQTKQEVLEGLYIDSTASCFGDINEQLDIPLKDKNNKEDALSQTGSINSQSVNGSWPNLDENTSKHTNLSEDSIGHSRNPSEIDSLDSNYIRKHYNFEAHLKHNDREDTPDKHRPGVTPEPPNINNTYEKECNKDFDNLEKYNNKDSSNNINNLTNCNGKLSSELNVIQCSNNSIGSDEVSIKNKHFEIHETSIQIKNDGTSVTLKSESDNQSLVSEHDDTISSPPDSITSYISISIPSSTEKPNKFEYLSNSLAEKTDQYCGEYSVKVNDQTLETYDQPLLEYNLVPTGINNNKPFSDPRSNSTQQTNNSTKDITKKPSNDIYITNTYIKCVDIPKTNNKICSSSRNITTEPFVTTLIENQYYSLPDINVSKCLRKSERIDAQLRQEDPEDELCEHTYEIAHSHFRDILTSKATSNYGQLNTIHVKKYNQPVSEIYFAEYAEPQFIQNFTRLEDDLKSVITVNSSNLDEKEYEEYSHFNTQQNERELNEIEGTIRNNKVIVKTQSVILSSEPNIDSTEHNNSTYNSNKLQESVNQGTKRTNLKKHYSLRQRDPKDNETDRLPSPGTVAKSIVKTNESTVNHSTTEFTKTNSLLSRVQSFKTSAESNVTIVPLSGHQTIVIDPPVTNDSQNNDQEINEKKLYCVNTKLDKCPIEVEAYTKDNQLLQNSKENKCISNTAPKLIPIDTSTHNAKEPFITIKLNKVIKTTVPKLRSDKIATVQYVDKPPSRLIIKSENNHILSETRNTLLKNMTRPQVLQVIDSKKNKLNSNIESDDDNQNSQPTENTSKENDSKKRSEMESKSDILNVKEKINNAVKTDIEYQEKLHSVKNYWSKLIDHKSENKNNDLQETKTDLLSDPYPKEKTISKSISNETGEANSETSVLNIVKSLESVKIVDSIPKISQTKLHLWKDESEKVKSDSEIEEPTVQKIIKNDVNEIYNVTTEEKVKGTEFNLHARDTPEIEIVELSSNDNENKKTQATLIKAKGYEKGFDEFDHVRYKVMKSELFKNSMIANYRKEAQFDGLLQYLQDYSFQELLVNNNIVIIEPVRTKIEPAPRSNTDTQKISPSMLKRNENNSLQAEKSKSAVRRHFFYHPIRVNREIIEEELPHPDTVKKVRNLFEDTLKMRNPMTNDPPLVEESVPLSRRATSYRNLNEDSRINKLGCKKKVARQLTIDTSFGHKKWDNASLSSGVSSGDLSSNNEYETDGLSPFQNKNLKDNVYSSSEEYLCDSIGNDFCCETQYVSPDALKKIRECGTSVTFYGGKVLNTKVGSVVSPMTKAIMDEIKVLQKNCSRDCLSCQTRCHGNSCSCLMIGNHKQKVSENKTVCQNQQLNTTKKQNESFPGFKFKLVKSNSCSSRLELTGTDNNKNSQMKYNELQYRGNDPPLLNDEENSVKSKIFRLESYNKGLAKTPFETKDQHSNISYKTKNTTHKVEIFNHDLGSENKKSPIESDKKMVNINEVQSLKLDEIENEHDIKDSDKGSDSHSFDKKYYYLNDTINQSKNTQGKFGEMVFEEFEVLESCYDSLNSNKSAK